MTDAEATMQIEVSLAWWLKPYFIGVAAMAAITGREIDWEKVGRMIDRAIRVRMSQP